MNTLVNERGALAAGAYGTSPESTQSAISWAAIIGGAVVAAAVSLILVALGSALGLSAISPWPGGASATTFTVMTAVWLIITQWVAAGFGGYLTGRLRTKWVATHTHEVFFRDTAHGFVAWALATVLTAALLVSAGSALAAGGARLAGAAGAAAAVAGPRNAGPPGSYDLDVLFRGGSPDSGPAAGADPRGEALRILANGGTGGRRGGRGPRIPCLFGERANRRDACGGAGARRQLHRPLQGGDGQRAQGRRRGRFVHCTVDAGRGVHRLRGSGPRWQSA